MDQTQTDSNSTALAWDAGTAYELFVSLHVLHEPEFYELRPSWAAGIRSRIPPIERTFLEEVVPFLNLPLRWVYQLPRPKDARSVFHALKQIEPAGRGIALLDLEQGLRPESGRLLEIARRHTWGKNDLAALTPLLCKEEPVKGEQALIKYLDRWAHPDSFGEMLLQSLQAYHQAFFEKEEQRVEPVLQTGLEHARQLSVQMNVSELITELSQGFRSTEELGKELIIVPDFWMTPLIILEKISPDQKLFLFGARPSTMSTIPGEPVPDGLLRTLKALADPTRLKILRYLYKEELGPTELSRRLDLRGPTIIHHLRELRLAGLVILTLRGQEKHYRARLEALDSTNMDLKGFIANLFEEKDSPRK
jgi:DNA-binding transcriptional ArsR family regulator